MRPAYALHTACVAVLLFACGCSSNKGKIEGTKWTSQAATVKGKAVPAGLMQLDFQSGGKLVMIVGGQNFTGTYSLGMGPTVTLNLDRDFNGSKTHAEKIVVNGEQLTMTDADGTQLAFQKAK